MRVSFTGKPVPVCVVVFLLLLFHFILKCKSKQLYNCITLVMIGMAHRTEAWACKQFDQFYRNLKSTSHTVLHDRGYKPWNCNRMFVVVSNIGFHEIENRWPSRWEKRCCDLTFVKIHSVPLLWFFHQIPIDLNFTFCPLNWQFIARFMFRYRMNSVFFHANKIIWCDSFHFL